MAQKTALQVDLTDPSGGTFAPDKVSLETGAGVVALTAAPFVFELSAAGSASLVVEKKGHHTFRFELQVTDSGNDFTVSIDKKRMLDAPRMVTLLKLGAVGKGPGPGRNQATIVVGEPREVLLVTGFDYPSDHGAGGMQFHLLATKRMHELRKAKKLDDSTVVTWFDAKSGLRTRWVTGRATEATTGPPKMWRSGWSRLSSDGTPPSTLRPSDADYPGVGVNGMPEIYQHVITIGDERPGSLEELSIMSHSWFGGPILFDTAERIEFAQGARRAERDPNDRDARFWKDFSSVNMPKSSSFVAAFSAAPFIRIWGCLATSVSLDVITRAARAKSDTQKLGIPPENRTLWFDGTTVFDDNRPGIIQFIKRSLLKSNYMAFLATVTGHPVGGGAPGMGALFTPLNAMGFQMFVARDSVRSKDKSGATVIINGFKRQMEFLEKDVGVVFSADGYLQYQP
ncbi:MAG: hypothetical protein K0R38_2317 [Polyangiaceae bacterium]|jgi:hypothetical protein|nr:hypothetical protein [Polyangiaceae bacterium]